MIRVLATPPGGMHRRPKCEVIFAWALSRLYRRHREETIAEALCRLRLERARHLLRANPNMLVKTVAYECGFSSCAYFTARYHKTFGRPPTEDRR